MRSTYFSVKTGTEINVAAECRRHLKKLGFKLISVQLCDLPWEARGICNTPLGVRKFFFYGGALTVLGSVIDDLGEVIKYPCCSIINDPLEGLTREDVEGECY